MQLPFREFFSRREPARLDEKASRTGALVALFLWASGSSGLLLLTLRELFAANARFDAFVRELARFNRRIKK